MYLNNTRNCRRLPTSAQCTAQIARRTAAGADFSWSLVRLPVFGLKEEGRAWLAIIEEGRLLPIFQRSLRGTDL